MVKKLSIYSIGLVLFATPTWTYAQEAAASGSSFYSDLGIYLLGALTLVVALSVVLILVKLSNDIIRQSEIHVAQMQGQEVAATPEGPPFWQTLYRRLTRVVPVEREKEILLDHNYDGIRELDNILPPWWLYMFYFSIAFGVLYYGYYHVAGKGLSSTEAYEVEMAEAQESVDAYLATQADLVDETNVEVLTDEASLSAGEVTYNTLCAVCHLPTGAGLVGPNLTDQYWIHGGDIKDLFRTIKYGVPEKGMISWSAQLRPAQMQEVASYILTLQGTNPANPKAPEGELYQPE